MSIPASLNPVINNATATISSADAPAFWSAIEAGTPLPAGKTAAQITGYHVVVQSNGNLSVNMTFKQ